jgi:AraC-like DNA-binding protein
MTLPLQKLQGKLHHSARENCNIHCMKGLEGHRLHGQLADFGDRICVGNGRAGVERAEVHICGNGFSPHRHDTYGIGLTLSGVQTFQYRGVRRYCLPRQCHILHPDEVHDGGAASDAGFSYRIVHVAPATMQRALSGKSLPFVADPVVDLGAESAELLSRLWNVDDDLEDVEDDEIVSSILGFLEKCSAGGRPARRRVIPWEALRRVCELLAAEPAVPCVAGELEIVSGLDRWTLAREFRAAYGTTPRSFRTMRQLDKVRSLLVGGVSLAAAAAEAGFSDQSHMSRMFKKVYGFTPMRWTSAVTPARGISRHGRNLAQ